MPPKGCCMADLPSKHIPSRYSANYEVLQHVSRRAISSNEKSQISGRLASRRCQGILALGVPMQRHNSEVEGGKCHSAF